MMTLIRTGTSAQQLRSLKYFLNFLFGMQFIAIGSLYTIFDIYYVPRLF